MFDYATETLLGLCLGALGWIGRGVNMVSTTTEQLYEWQKPNEQGVQTWKGNPEAIDKLVTKIDDLTSSVREFLVEIRARER